MTNPVTKSISYWAYLNSVWTDITSYCLQEIPKQCYRGMTSNTIGDNLAQVGSFTFTVQNSSGKFDPDSATALAGWKKGTAIEIRVLYTARTFKRFRCYIDSIKPNDISVGDHTCTVTCVDYMKYIYESPFTAPTIQTNKTGDVAVNALIAALPIQPQATAIQTGSYTYPAIFDTATTSTKMSTELKKVVDSEGSYFYIRCDSTYGETLVFENALARNGLVTAKQLPETLADSHYLIDHLGRYLIDHAGRRLKANESCNCVLGDGINSLDRNNGTVINKATIRAFPKKTDTSNQVLYRLDSPMLLGSGETKTFKGRYTNPTQTTSTQVNAVQTSMSVTTKTMNTAIDGSGTDLSANLTATAVFYSSYPEWTVYNSSVYTGYITVLTASGLGVYQDNPITFSVEDTTSQNSYGINETTVDQQYQRDIAPGTQLISGILNDNKQPSTMWNKVTFQADRSDELMIAFLNVDIGDMIQITNTEFNTNSYFFIQGIEFTISQGELITFSWILKKYESLSLGLSPIAVEFHASSTDMLDYGYLKQASNLTERSISAWVYRKENFGTGTIATISTPSTGWWLESMSGHVYWNRRTTTQSGVWFGDHVVPTLNTWYHVVITESLSLSPTETPLFYIDGVSTAFTETAAPIGILTDETGKNLSVGNINVGGTAYTAPFRGIIKDFRIYNRSITSTEAALLYSEGAYGTGVLDGLVFQAPTVKTKQLTYFTDKTLTDADKMIDNIHGAIGTPHGSPITRLL